MQLVRGVFFPETEAEPDWALDDFAEQADAIRRIVLNQCSRMRRAVEVGAHVGLYARELARHFVSVEAFEPQPQVFGSLAANLSPLGVGLHQTAVADEARVGFISERPGRHSEQSVLVQTRERRTLPCPVRPIDAYGWKDVDLIRVGLEDAGAVLAGAMQTISRSRPVLWLNTPSAAGFELDARLEALGYRLAASLPGGLVMAVEQGRAARPLRTLLLADGADRHLVQLSPAEDQLGLADERVAIDGRLMRAARVAFQTDAGRGELLKITLPGGVTLSDASTLLREGVVTSLSGVETVDVDSLLSQVTATFREGAFRISTPPELLALYRGLVVSLKRTDGERVVARVDLRLAENLDDIAVRPPLAMTDDRILGLRLDFHRAGGEPRALERPARLDPAEFTADLVTCYLNHGGGGNPVINAFASGIGARRAYAEDGARDGVAIVWGVLRNSKTVIDAVQARNGHFYYIDHAYFARGHLLNYRITRNGFEAGPMRQCPLDRLEGLGVELQPWKSGGRYILVCPPTDYFMEAHGAHSWLEDTLAALRTHTDREIIVRLKPQPGEAVTPLAEAMAGAHALVTHSSNVAVEAVVAGTPVFVSPTSAAAPMGLTDLARIEDPVRPDRMPWLAHLTYSQFSFEEVKYGTAWRLLREFEARPFL